MVRYPSAELAVRLAINKESSSSPSKRDTAIACRGDTRDLHVWYLEWDPPQAAPEFEKLNRPAHYLLSWQTVGTPTRPRAPYGRPSGHFLSSSVGTPARAFQFSAIIMLLRRDYR